MVIEINNISGKIIDHLNINQLAVIQQECQFKMEGSEYKAMSFKSKGIKWDGYKRLFNIQTRAFPSGLLSRIVDLCNRVGIEVEIVDKRKHINKTYKYEYDDSMLRDYQRSSVISSLVHGSGILKVATGGGKTVIAGCTIGALQKKSIFIVHTRDLLYQAKDSFQRIFPNENIGQIGDGIIDYQNITVATMQTLAILGNIEIGKDHDEDAINDEVKIIADNIKRSEFNAYRKTVQCVMMDEVQIVCSQMAQGVRFLFDYADSAFGYSASPWRDDGSDLAIEAAFGKRIVDITASELIRKGYLVRPTIEVHRCNYVTTDISGNYVDIYKRYIVENTVRNMQIINDAIKRYNDGMNTLILVTQINHGNTLAEMIKIQYGINVSFISGKSGMKKRKKAIQDMRNGEISLLIASTIADVGLDIPRLQCIVEAGAGKSSVTALQRLGRVMRPFENKDSCVFISYADSAPFISQHIDKKISIWRTEEEFMIYEY